MKIFPNQTREVKSDDVLKKKEGGKNFKRDKLHRQGNSQTQSCRRFQNCKVIGDNKGRVEKEAENNSSLLTEKEDIAMSLDLYGQKSGGNRNVAVLHNEIVKLKKRPEGQGKKKVEDRILELLPTISLTPEIKKNLLEAKPSQKLLEKLF